MADIFFCLKWWLGICEFIGSVETIFSWMYFLRWAQVNSQNFHIHLICTLGRVWSYVRVLISHIKRSHLFKFSHRKKLKHGGRWWIFVVMLASPVCIELSSWQILPAKQMEDVLEQAFEGGCPWRQHSKLWQPPRHVSNQSLVTWSSGLSHIQLQTEFIFIPPPPS